jgi:hypothetical protein
VVVRMVVSSQGVVKLRHGPLCTGLVEALANGRRGRRNSTPQDNSLRFRASWGTLIDVA